MSKEDTKQIELYEAKVNELVNVANILTITTPEENAIVIECKAKLNTLGKEYKTEKEKATKPINEALRRIRSWWAPLETRIENEDIRLGGMLLTYKHKIEAEVRKQEERIAARVEKGTMRLDTAEKKIDNLPKIQNTTHTAEGQVQFRKIPKMRITNRDLVPDSYWIIDEVRLRQAVVSGIVVPGAQLYFEERV